MKPAQLKELGTVGVVDGGPVTALALSPRNDALYVVTGTRVTAWPFDAGHPEASWFALFGKVHYESHAEPSWLWQSSSGSDGFEPKLSLVPLIFGTFKATFYAVLFGLPLALLAAIYTSEFLPHRLRSGVKSVVELMASMPSVVLGFLAGVVLAPLLVDLLPALAASVVLVPTAVLAGVTRQATGGGGGGTTGVAVSFTHAASASVSATKSSISASVFTSQHNSTNSNNYLKT